MVKAVFFDFDGVLTSEKNDIVVTCRYIADKLSKDEQAVRSIYEKSGDVWNLYGGKTTESAFWKEFFKKLAEASLISMPYDKFEKFREKAFESTQLDSEMVCLARDIKNSGNKVGIITDNCKERIAVINKKYKLYILFDLIIVSAEEKTTKHEKGIFEKSIKKSGITASDSVFIDNNPDNCSVAEKAGMKAIHFDEVKRDYGKLLQDLIKLGLEIK